MKKYIKISLILMLTAGVFAGCESWFDVKPKKEVRASELFESEEGFWGALTGVYMAMGHEHAYGGDMSWRGIEYLGWNHANLSSLWGSYYDLQMNDYDEAKAKTFINNTWAKLYNIIAEANYFLQALEEYGNVLRPEVYDNMKAQALMIRAYCHFDLMRMYAQGNLANDVNRDATLAKPCVPYVTKYGVKITGQRPYGETLQMAVNDATAALELFMSADNVPSDKRVNVVYSNMNRHAARLLLARIELWRGDKEKALEWANKLIDVAGSTFKWASDTAESGVFKSELVFYLTVYNLPTLTEEIWYVGNRNKLISVEETSVEDGLFMTADSKAYLNISTSDLRYINWYFPFTDPNDSSNDGTYSIKIRNGNPDVMELNPNSIVPLMRLSEAFLIAAECQVETDRDAAIGLVNTVRIKRGNSQERYMPSTVTDDELREAILYEQAREFPQEGQLFFLYKRLNTTYAINTRNSSNPMNAGKYMLPYPDVETDVAGHTNKD